MEFGLTNSSAHQSLLMPTFGDRFNSGLSSGQGNGLLQSHRFATSTGAVLEPPFWHLNSTSTRHDRKADRPAYRSLSLTERSYHSQRNDRDFLTGHSQQMPLVGVERFVNLRADTNRDGKVTDDDNLNEMVWNQSQGAIILPNLDDDSGKWRRLQQRLKIAPDITGDRQLAKLNDANDEIVNGRWDAEDLAPVHIAAWRNAPANSQIRLYADARSQPYVRMFVNRNGKYTSIGSNGLLTIADLRRGLNLGIEATDIVRNSRRWNGFVTLTLDVKTAETTYRDRVKLRVSPVLFQHNLMPVKELYALRSADKNFPFPVDKSIETQPAFRKGFQAFRRDLAAALSGDSSLRLRPLQARGNMWTQDFFEPGYVAMPKPEGRQQIMHILLRNPFAQRLALDKNGNYDLDKNFNFNPLTTKVYQDLSGRSLFTELRGRDIGAVQQFDPGNPNDLSLNQTGNFEAIPPYMAGNNRYGVGQIIFGGGAEDFHPDSSFVRMLQSQGYQDPIMVDTSWLSVSHVDEIVNFLPAPTLRGWVLAVPSPSEAWRIFQNVQNQGQGSVSLFKDFADDSISPKTTVDAVLADMDLQQINLQAEQKIEETINTLKLKTGLTDAEIIRLPVLFQGALTSDPKQPLRYSGGLTRNVVNSVVVNKQFLAPRQYGPVINGVDLLQDDVERKLNALGMTVNWIETWEYTRGAGEVHCTTNTLRDATPFSPWWTSYYSGN